MGPQYSVAANQVDAKTLGVGLAVLGGLLIFLLIIILIVYIYMAVCLMKIAKKTNTPNAWMAWIPIANLVLMIQIAKKPMWWIAVFFLPIILAFLHIPVVSALLVVVADIASIILTILIWAGIAKELGKPQWLGILMIVPVANLVIPGYLAFSSKNAGEAPAPQQPIVA